jgi:hypothetical protein
MAMNRTQNRGLIHVLFVIYVSSLDFLLNKMLCI